MQRDNFFTQDDAVEEQEDEEEVNEVGKRLLRVDCGHSWRSLIVKPKGMKKEKKSFKIKKTCAEKYETRNEMAIDVSTNAHRIWSPTWYYS